MDFKRVGLHYTDFARPTPAWRYRERGSPLYTPSKIAVDFLKLRNLG